MCPKAKWVCYGSVWIFCTPCAVFPCSLLFFLPPCMDLSFTEIVNQLNALSCLHGDDDDDDGGVHKRARKATAKPAASSQGLFFTFLSPPSSCLPLFIYLNDLWTVSDLDLTTHYHHFRLCIYSLVIHLFPIFLKFWFSFPLAPPSHPTTSLNLLWCLVLWSCCAHVILQF